MAGLWKHDPKTPEGKYPIVLRRDGSALENPYMVLVLHDPAVAAALHAYADEADELGYDSQFVSDVRGLANDAARLAEDHGDESDADAPPHRTDDPVVLAWARSLQSPGA